jgi:hypothetical protein
VTDLTYRSSKTEVRESSIHGRGLFAKAAIAKGDIVAVKGGHVLTRAAWTVLEWEAQYRHPGADRSRGDAEHRAGGRINPRLGDHR